MDGIKYDAGKLRWDLLPIEEVESVVAVLTKGAIKYEDDNWKKVEPYKNRYYSACLRHLVSWRKGELIDKETELPHLAHAICCLIFLLWGDKNK